jgi:selenocysteine-specific elongation factor
MYVVGTAGHVDHGKSTLVKTLTGIDPDRWEEEQRREMTIDLGFAWLTLPSGRPVSLIDVPGHERFIKNMLAGVGGIDAALLIVAADESIMPQTEEHLAILDIHHGVVVLTKVDLVETDWLALVHDDIRARLLGTSLEHAPIIPVSARSGHGIPDLLATLDAALTAIPSRSIAQGNPRLPIDRSFTIGGFGAVATGTLLDGPLTVGDEVEILPKGLRARVRGLQTHQQREEKALPGSRVAVNLAGISHHDIARGDLLALPGRVAPTSLVDAWLQLARAARPVLQNDRLDLFVGASEVPCRVTLLNSESIDPGEGGWVQLRLERPIACLRGDRYILRQPSPSRTLGGGQIVDTRPARHRRFRPEVSAALALLARGTPADLLRPLLVDGLPHSWAELQRASGLPDAAAREGIAELLDDGFALDLRDPRPKTQDPRDTELRNRRAAEPSRNENQGTPAIRNTNDQSPISNLLISTAGWEALRGKLEQVLSGYHRRYPLRAGMAREELRQRLKLTAEGADGVVPAAVAAGWIGARETLVWASGHEARPTPEQSRIMRRVLEQCRREPYSPPAPELDSELLTFLIERGELVRVADEIVFLPQFYQEMAGWVLQQIDAQGSITVAQFRDRFGSSRKYALALLEQLDERKITRRVGDTRVRY